MKDIIGKSIIVAVLLLTAAIIVGISGPVVAMDRATMVLMFWGGDSAPVGTTYLTDSDGAYLTDSDGAYLTL